MTLRMNLIMYSPIACSRSSTVTRGVTTPLRSKRSQSCFTKVNERQRKRGGDFELTFALGRLAMKINNDRELSEKHPDLANRDLASERHRCVTGAAHPGDIPDRRAVSPTAKTPPIRFSGAPSTLAVRDLAGLG